MAKRKEETDLDRSTATDSARTPHTQRTSQTPPERATHQEPGAPGCGIRCVHLQDVAETRAHLRDGATYQAMADLLAALADPIRAQVVHLLMRQDLCSCDLAATPRMNAQYISQRLRVLRAAHVVKYPPRR